MLLIPEVISRYVVIRGWQEALRISSRAVLASAS